MGRPKKPVLPEGSLTDPVDAESLPDAHMKIVDVHSATPEQIAALLAENAALQERLALETEARGEAEQRLLDQAVAQLGQAEIMEVPTGKTVKLKRLDLEHEGEDRMGYRTKSYREDGRPNLAPVWKDVDLPTYFYRIDLPPSGGECMKINGEAIYHGTVIECDIDRLRSIKEIIYRGWDHERNISGSNENAYRTPKKQRLSAARMH